MRVLFDYHELLNVVENGVNEPAQQQPQNKHGYLDDFLKGEEKVKKVKLQTLRRQFELLQIESSEGMSKYIDRLLAITNDMRNCEEEITEQLKVKQILRTLTTRFDHVVTSIEVNHDLSEMRTSMLSGTLEAQELGMHGKKVERPIEQALQAQSSTGTNGNNEFISRFGNLRRGRGGYNRGNRDGNKNFRANNDQNQGRFQKRNHDKSKVECFRCHKFGHFHLNVTPK
ncbi:hypothetical protein LIER_35617 [Lithospermum erythrorhizon]|uniref:Uncharacterized protein n=1 Tax=Lithospermum erythrorhizon TaxID=34254 RepID=A0AAV3NTL5_LITER